MDSLGISAVMPHNNMRLMYFLMGFSRENSKCFSKTSLDSPGIPLQNSQRIPFGIYTEIYLEFSLNSSRVCIIMLYQEQV